MLYAVLGEETAWKGPGMIIMEPTVVADGWWRGRSGPETEPCTYPFCRSPCNTPTYKRSATKIILCTLYCVRIYDMLGTMHPGNTVPKGGGCLHIQCMYLQPKNSIGRVEISDRNGHRNGVMIHKMDGTSRDAHELPETEVVPHIHSNSIVSRVRVLCTPYFWACFEWNSVHNVYLSTWDLQGLTLQVAGGGQTWSKARPSGQRGLPLHRLTGLRGCLKGGWGLMTSWVHAPLKGQHTCSCRWGEMVLQCPFTRDTSVIGSDPYTRYYKVYCTEWWSYIVSRWYRR